MGCVRTHSPIQGRTKWPVTNGTRICSTIAPNEPAIDDSAALPETSKLTSIGVRKTANTFEADALQIAAGTFPPAIEVNAIDD